MLEAIMDMCRQQGGDLFLMRLEEHVFEFIQAHDFYNKLGPDHFLAEDQAISHLFHRILDPPICIYECNTRTFKECQNLPKQTYLTDSPLQSYISPDTIASISPQDLQQKLFNGHKLLIIDVREPREFKHGHIPQAKLVPLPEILSAAPTLPQNRDIVCVCRGGWRSTRAVSLLKNKGYQNVWVLQGGMLAWEAAGLREVIDY
jgi:SulP family sulfate permease